MLKLRRIEIENFAFFDNIVIEPSVNPDKPLTVIRAENGSGKTTLLRAIRWSMYGEKGLPVDSKRFSVHPAWWHPKDDKVKTTVIIEFETDGSNRDDTNGNLTTTTFRLVRSVETIGNPSEKDDEPDFRRVHEETQLMYKESDRIWRPHTAGVDIIIEQLLPWGLRDFFVMDADEATDFVGGSENKPMVQQDVIDKTTSALHNLLGLETFKEASRRIANKAQELGVQATRAVGSDDLNALQDKLNQMRSEALELENQLEEQQIQVSKSGKLIRQKRLDLENELRDMSADEDLRKRLKANQIRDDKAIKERTMTLNLLAGELESIDLLASLATSQITRAYEMLKPLYELGRIPLKHLNFVRNLLRSGTCVCGQDISEDGSHRHNVEDRISKSAEQEERANYLGQLYDAAQSLKEHALTTGWDNRHSEYVRDLATLDDELSELTLEKQEIETKLDAIEEEKIHLIRGEITVLETKKENLDRAIIRDEMRLAPLKESIDSYEKKISQRQRNERAAADKRAAKRIAELVVRILDQAYDTIQTEQVNELSQRMNRLFVQMADNVSDNDFEDIRRNEATLRMITEVGIRSLGSNSDEYEIYALNNRRRPMPAIEINGASRRVLALSFILALCIESRTYAPLIADSLLNFMSGTVRYNTLRVATISSSQPILLLTGSDLEAPEVFRIIDQYADSTYTLTGQWDAVEGGDVVNLTSKSQVALVCTCGPRQYCDICERIGQATSSGWTKRS